MWALGKREIKHSPKKAMPQRFNLVGGVESMSLLWRWSESEFRRPWGYSCQQPSTLQLSLEKIAGDDSAVAASPVTSSRWSAFSETG